MACGCSSRSPTAARSAPTSCATLLETPLSTVYRYLRTLTEFGFVERMEGGYKLGQRLHLTGGTTVSSEELIRHADPILRMLVDEAGETAVIARRVGLTAVCLHEVQSGHALRVTCEPGSATPLVSGALAKVLLAYAPDGDPGRGARRGRQRQGACDASSRPSWKTASLAARGSCSPAPWTMAVPILRDDGIVAAIGRHRPGGAGDPALACAGEPTPGRWRRRDHGGAARIGPADRPSVLSRYGISTFRHLTIVPGKRMLRGHMDAFAALAPGLRGLRDLPVAEAFDWSRRRPPARRRASGTWSCSAPSAASTPTRSGWPNSTIGPITRPQSSPGFVHYFKGPAEADRSCLSFCLWTSRAEARAASGRPAHIEAVSVINEMYERYTLEFLRVTGRAGSPLQFEPYDAAPAADPAGIVASRVRAAAAPGAASAS